MAADVMIRKQRISLNTTDEHLAFKCKAYLDEHVNTGLNQMYEQVFHQSSPSDEYLIIDQLIVNMGHISTEELEHNFLNLLQEKLIDELTTQFEADFREAEEQAFSAQTGERVAADPILYSTKQEQDAEALLHFLQTGRFPWWYAARRPESPAELLATLNTETRKRFLVQLISRIHSLHSTSFPELMVRRLFIYLPVPAYETYFRELSELHTANMDINFQDVLDQKQELIGLFRMTERNFYEEAAFCMVQHSTTTNFLEAFLKHIRENYSTNRESPYKTPEKPLEDLEFHARQEESDINTPSRKSTNSNTDPIEESIYISNAGLVILHPFLAACFQTLGLLDQEEQFVSADARIHAAVLLSYLQCGNQDYKEWEMPLNKILCGLRPEEFIPDNFILSDVDIQEANLLLKAVVEYWTALRSCSIEALQTSFLQRTGKMRLKEDTWLIQVERTGVDILLDRLPWGIGAIKLPWLKEMISVEW